MSDEPILNPEPLPPQPLGYATPGGGKRCPKCGLATAKKCNFTWWGGALGPKLFDHHKCGACGYTFNGKTGQPNTTAIAIYLAVGAVIGLIAGFFIFYQKARM
jgi:hypothetical protein